MYVCMYVCIYVTIRRWKDKKINTQGASAGCQLCLGTKDLPHNMRDAFDPDRKRCKRDLV